MTRGSWRGRRRPWYVPTAVLALVVLVAACDGAEPVEPTTSTTETSDEPTTEEPTTEEPTEVPSPDRPAGLTEDSPDAALAAVAYFLDHYAYVYATADLATWTAMSGPECAFCQSVVEGVQEMADAGGVLRGGEIVPTEMTVEYVPEGGFYRVSFSAVQGEATVVNADGTIEVVDPVSFEGAVVNVIFDVDAWTVLAVHTGEVG
ncbi:DUF6318 family protein [Occultella gossypii]|uniref:DUF6318 domain-containing protein n=1 Tax=Occultella gossypii TaxID=2800820 RepID=A0ABS7S7S2_9MICO|nr:DUF6318 family protein [Occultella gossypii]MBZ2195790.1 hypothetical protein [Occultella gossypii]